jgi:hypothetical protein
MFVFHKGEANFLVYLPAIPFLQFIAKMESNLATFNRFIYLCANYAGQILNRE